jgi:hypothetical protein
MSDLKQKYDGKTVSTDEYAEARTTIVNAIDELEKITMKTGPDYILLKWGSLKGWEMNSEKGKQLGDEYLKHGRSMSAMAQKDDPRQKEIILEMIDECDGSIQNDWDGNHYTKQQAKDYITGYDTNRGYL